MHVLQSGIVRYPSIAERCKPAASGVSPGQKYGVDTHGEHVEHEPITGVWGRSPSGVPEQSPWSGGQEAKPGKSEMDMSTPVHPVATPLGSLVNSGNVGWSYSPQPLQEGKGKESGREKKEEKGSEGREIGLGEQNIQKLNFSRFKQTDGQTL